MNETTANKHIALRARDLRIASGLTQAYIAKKLKVSVQLVSRAERGKVTMTAGRLYRLARILNAAPGDFFPNGVGK